MKKIILAPDSFKGTMTADTVCNIWQFYVKKYFPDCEIVRIPMADGGEGMVDAYLKILGGDKVYCTVSDPLGKPIKVYYAVLPNRTAVMEMAACSGFPLMNGKLDILHATTYGVGEMLIHASKNGIKNVVLGIGGSATNDCGIGMAAALGYKFFSGADEVLPYAVNMNRITKIVKPQSLPNLAVTAACDVDNPLYGENGATYIFGTQKGATDEIKPVLDDGLKNMSRVIKSDLNCDVANLKGAGAAGGLGAGLKAFIGGNLKSGIDLILDTAEFDKLLIGTDLVITGEGKIDGQSVHGKVPVGIGLRAKKAGVPCLALCGSIGDNAEQVYDYGINAIFAAVNTACDFEKIRTTCEKDMGILANSVMRLIKLKY